MTNLNIQIEELISNNAKDFEIAKVIKQEIKTYLSSLDTIFTQSQGKDFFVKHTKQIDGFIQLIYKYLLRKYFGNYQPMSNSIPITLIALGSYGREQLCIYSDIDIMLLYEDINGYNLKPIMEEFMTLAWDSGLKLGSRVHEIKEIEEAVKTDITIKTSILESRMIYGSKHLWFYFQNKLNNIRKFKRKEFVLEKLEEHKLRLLKHPLSMQPNIKDGYGGMRESNLLFWIANITYGVHSSKELIGRIFSEDEYKNYRGSLEYIFKIRNALHLTAKKKQDIISFDILPELSSKLGFEDTSKLVKERQLMSKVFESLHTIHRFTSIMVKKILRQYLFDKHNYPIVKQYRYDKNLYIIKNKVYSSFFNKPKTLNNLLKELISLPDYIEEFDSSYVYYASKTKKPNSINMTLRKTIYTLLNQNNLSSIIKLLYNSELFQTVLPSLKKIINQPQFDGYHIHPVDIHSIKTLKNIEHIEDNFVLNAYNSISKKEQTLLKMIALFHDSGKGRGKDHHIVGMQLFRKFAKLLNMEDDIINTGAKIIRYHNMMSKVATTEDIYSQNVILNFTGLIGDVNTLKLLYILTYADISAVDKSIYSSSTASLLRELFLQSLPAFENEELLKVTSRRIAKENTIKNLESFKELTKLMQKKILSIASNELFLRYKASDIMKISQYANKVENFDYKVTNSDFLTIRIIRVIPLNLGFLLGKLNFLSIRSMGIYKLFDEKKFFEITFDKTVSDDDILYIEDIINNSFDMSASINLKKSIIYKKDIEIDCNHTENLAQLKISAKDQKGLFAFIAKVLDDFGIEIQSAKIHSVKGKVDDLLLVEKNGKFCTNEVRIIDILTSNTTIGNF